MRELNLSESKLCHTSFFRGKRLSCADTDGAKIELNLDDVDDKGAYAFIWFHEFYHYVQFNLDGRLYPYDLYENNDLCTSDSYYYIWPEKEANAFALHMCEKYGFDYNPTWLPEGYIKEIRDYVW